MAKGRKTGGRQKGSLNKTTLEVREAARVFLSDPQGQKQLLEQFRDGKLNPATLQMFYHYAYGKPPDKLQVSGDEDGSPLRVMFGGRYKPPEP